MKIKQYVINHPIVPVLVSKGFFKKDTINKDDDKLYCACVQRAIKRINMNSATLDTSLKPESSMSLLSLVSSEIFRPYNNMHID